MTTAIDTAVDAFRATLVERGALAGAADADAAAVGRRAALLVESATAWADHLGRLLDLRATMEVLGVTTRQAVYDLAARHRLLGLPRQGGGMAFPAFQFDPTTGRPYDALSGLLATFAAGGVDAYTAATWLATGQDELDGRSPASQLADPSAADGLRQAAERARGPAEPLSAPPANLTDFPAHVLAAGTPLYRIHRADRSPWWFSTEGTGRFDLPLPIGTCYLAEEPLAALLEIARGLTILSEDFLAARRLLTTTLAFDLRLADLTVAAAYRFGVTGELAASTDYAAPQAWALALHGAGFDGIRYHVRHDPRGQLAGVAWFDPAPDDPQSTGHSQELPAGILLDAAPFGIRLAANLPPEV